MKQNNNNDQSWTNDFWLMGSKGGSVGSQRYPQDDPEGVTGALDQNGNLITTGAVSVTRIEVLDLMSEGEIKGFVTGNYVYTGYVGQIGYSGYEFKPYPVAPGTTDARWLRSVYWNEVPLVDSDNRYNFSNLDTSYSPGYPNGFPTGSAFLNQNLTVTKAYGERLRGVYSNPNTEQTIAGSALSDYAKTYRILNRDCKGVIVNVKFGQLYSRNVTLPPKGDPTKGEYGDVERTSVEWQVEYRPLFSDMFGEEQAFISPPTMDYVGGKITYGYIKSTTVLFSPNALKHLTNKNFIGWEIKVTRLTQDSTSTTLVNQTYIDSITQIYGDKFTYPNSAITRAKFDAEYFSQVPNRTFHIDGIKVKIPNNYDPIRKFYTGDWDGTFTTEKVWTDNPAWCFYDLITNRRYGLGKYISESQIDKWTLYKIAQYCDEIVSDGFGGVEPRFTCNLVINGKDEAFKVLNDFASIFRGILYYSNGSIFAVQDSIQNLNNVIMQFTNANVKDGNFNYTTSPRNTISTVAVIRYNDKNNFYKPAIEYVEDIEAIKKYGIREIELSAFGCTSRGQAIRLGRWALFTENNEYESIGYVAGTEGALLRPGDVVKVYDNFRNYDRLGGRVNSFISTTVLELDSNVSGIIASGNLTGNHYNITLTTPTFNYQPGLVDLDDSSQIPYIRNYHVQTQRFTGISATGVVSGKSRINLTGGWNFSSSFNSGVQVSQTIWTIDLVSGTPLPKTNQSEYWRIINVKEEQVNEYSVLGIRYNNDKYNYVDSGTSVSQTITQPYYGLPTSPTSLNLTSEFINSVTRQQVINYEYAVPNLNNIKAFDIYIKKAPRGEVFTDEEISSMRPNLSNDYTVFNGQYNVLEDGYYYFRVYSRNANHQLSAGFAAAETGIINEFFIKDAVINDLMLLEDSGQNLENDTSMSRMTGNYTSSSPTFVWDLNRGVAQNFDPEAVKFRMTIRKPSNTNFPDEEYYYQVTGIVPTQKTDFSKGQYEFPISENIAISPPLSTSLRPPYRNYDVVIEAHDINGVSSAGGNFSTNINSLGLPDSTYINGNGYDILYVQNDAITGVYLTTGGDYQTSFRSGDFHNDYVIGSDGRLSLTMLTGTKTFPDAVGGFLYYHTGFFTTGDAVTFDRYLTGPNTSNAPYFKSGYVPFTLPEGGISEYPYNINIPITFDDDVGSRYIRYSLADVFDYNKTDSLSQNGLTISNCQQVFRNSPLTKGVNPVGDLQLIDGYAFIKIAIDDSNLAGATYGGGGNSKNRNTYVIPARFYQTGVV